MSSPQPLPEEPENEWDLTEWTEVLAQQRPASPSFNLNNQSDSITTRVEWKKLRSCLQQVLGYSYADDAAPFKLYRP